MEEVHRKRRRDLLQHFRKSTKEGEDLGKFLVPDTTLLGLETGIFNERGDRPSRLGTRVVPRVLFRRTSFVDRQHQTRSRPLRRPHHQPVPYVVEVPGRADGVHTLPFTVAPRVGVQTLTERHTDLGQACETRQSPFSLHVRGDGVCKETKSGW